MSPPPDDCEPSATSELQPGLLIAGRYRLRERVGEGAMGVVWEAEHVELGRQLAVKVLSPEAAGHQGAVERFEREARTASRIRHPNIVDVLDLGRLDDGSPFLVMEYLQGRTLEDELEDVLEREATFSLADTCAWLRPVAAALDCIHAEGILHRDVKPANIMRVGDPAEGRVKLVDFGLAALKDAPWQRKLTVAGTIVGTPDYLSPEAAAGEPLDGRADVYALACVAFELLTGETPHARDSVMGILTAKLTDPAPAFSERLAEAVGLLALEAFGGEGLLEGLDRVFARGLARDPSERYGRAGELLRDLVRVAEGRPLAADDEAPSEPPVAIETSAEARPGQRAEPSKASGRGLTPRRSTGLALALMATTAIAVAIAWVSGALVDGPREPARGALGAVEPGPGVAEGAAAPRLVTTAAPPPRDESEAALEGARSAERAEGSQGPTAPGAQPEAGSGPAEGAAEQGVAERGATNEGATNEGATNEGAADEGAAAPGAQPEAGSGAAEGAAEQGVVERGATNEGATNEGAAGEGAVDGPPSATGSERARPSAAARRSAAAELVREARVFLLAGRLRDARSSLRRATQRYPGSSDAWRTLGLVEERLGDRAAARAAYQRYLRLAPRAADAARVRQRLSSL